MDKPRMSEKTINIDGTDHGQDCSSPMCKERWCVPCGVFMHREALYNGLIYVCPECGEEEI